MYKDGNTLQYTATFLVSWTDKILIAWGDKLAVLVVSEQIICK